MSVKMSGLRLRNIILATGACILLALPALSQTEGEKLNRSITVTGLINDDGWGHALRGPTALFYDSISSEIFVADAGNNRILIYDRELNPLFSFRHYVPDRTGQRIISGEPRDLAVNSDGEIIILDSYVDFVDIMDFRGRRIERVYLEKLFGDTSVTIKPQCVTVDSKDNVYIGTTGDISAVFVLNRYYELIRIIGSEKSDVPAFNTIIALTVYDGTLYTTDLYAEPAVKKFDTSGSYLGGFAGHDVDRTDVSFPSAIGVMVREGKKLIWVADGLRQVIKVYHDDGEFVAFVGGFGVKPGEFRYPDDLELVGDSVCYIVERVGGRIQRFDLD